MRKANGGNCLSQAFVLTYYNNSINMFSMTAYHNAARTLDTYIDQLYFGLLSLNPDSLINDFLKRYVPVVFKSNDSKDGWAVHPPDYIKEPGFYTAVHSYIFDSHPYFDGPFETGQLDITQKIYLDEKWNDNIIDINLWFGFDNKEDSEKSYRQLIDTFSSFNVLKRITSMKGIDKAEFTDKNSDRYYSNIQILLVTDYTPGKRHLAPVGEDAKIMEETGYKIVVEVGNDLY